VAHTSIHHNGAARGVAAVGIALRSLQAKIKLSSRMAENAAPGRLCTPDTELADETERAVTVLGKPLAEATSDVGKSGDG
jgi:two-component system chemotaxis response regulator CheB